MKNHIEEILTEIDSLFQKEKINYMVIGGIANLYYGSPRLTADIDITVILTPDKAEKVLKILQNSFEPVVGNWKNFAKETFVLPLRERKTKLKIDIIFGISPYEKEAFSRVKRVNLGRRGFNICGLEDFIIHKLVSGRERDIEDLKGVFRKNKSSINAKLLMRLAKEFSSALERGDILNNLELLMK